MFDLASDYTFSLNQKDRDKAMRAFLLLYNLEKYVNGAIIEMNRLSRIRIAIDKDIQKAITQLHRRKNFNLTYLANDTHFYFVCIDKVYRLLFNLGVELNDPDIKALARKLGKTFDIRTIRNHLEHIDDRCLGFLTLKDKQKGIRKHISDFGNFTGDSFSFNGRQFPSGKGSLSDLKQIYIDLVGILEKKYASKDPNYVWRKQSKQRYKQIMQGLKKAGLLWSGNDS